MLYWYFFSLLDALWHGKCHYQIHLLFREYFSEFYINFKENYFFFLALWNYIYRLSPHHRAARYLTHVKYNKKYSVQHFCTSGVFFKMQEWVDCSVLFLVSLRVPCQFVSHCFQQPLLFPFLPNLCRNRWCALDRQFFHFSCLIFFCTFLALFNLIDFRG